MADNTRSINRKHTTDALRYDYAHVGLYDVLDRHIWIAKKSWHIPAVRVAHAKLLVGGTQDTSTAQKDHYICFWFHTPGTGQGHVHGYPIEWDEGHLMVRLDPNWSYHTRQFIPTTDSAKVEKNIEQQYAAGRALFAAYTAIKPPFPVSWHMVGPRATDSMFYIERYDPAS